MISPNPRACCFSRLIPWKNKGLSGPVGEVTGNEGGTSGNYPQTGATPGGSRKRSPGHGGMTLTDKVIRKHRVSGGANRESGCRAMRNGGIGNNVDAMAPR